MKKDINLTYVNALCRSRETKLVGAERLRRMAEAEGLSQAFDLLRESAFGGDGAFSYEEYNKIIDAEEALLNKFVKEYAPDKSISFYCLLPLDFYNAQAILKSKFLKLPYEQFLAQEGLYSAERLSAAVDGDLGGLEKELVSAIEDARAALNAGGGGMEVGSIFASRAYKCLRRVVKPAYLRDIIAREEELTNVSACIRAGDSELALSCLTEGCTLTRAQIDALCQRSVEECKRQFAKSDIKGVVVQAVAQAKEGKPLIELERERSSVAALKLLESKYTAVEGTKPFVSYYLSRKNEIANVRTVLTGKANGLDVEQIKRRLINV